MKNIIFDGKDYYLFRSLNDEDKQDSEKEIKNIRSDASRYYETHGEWGKYSNNSKTSLEEVYDHIKIDFRRDTNCISLAEDANVVLTYHTDNPKYVLVKISPEQLNDFFVAGDYFLGAIERQVENIEKSLSKGNEIGIILKKIENAVSINEIIKILKDINSSIETYMINKKQYLTDDEQMNMSKIIAKLKVLEHNRLIGNIIEGIPNDELFLTMENAYTSSEYIHYGDISSEQIIHCPKIIIEMFALIQQAQKNGVDNSEINRLNNKVLKLLKEWNKEIKQRDDINSIELSFLTRENSYNDTIMQFRDISLLAEMILKKKAIVEYFKKVFPEEKNIDKILEDTYCINPKLAIKQNGRGYKLSNTVNLLISDKGQDLSQEDTKMLLNRVSALSKDQLLEIFNN